MGIGRGGTGEGDSVITYRVGILDVCVFHHFFIFWGGTGVGALGGGDHVFKELGRDFHTPLFVSITTGGVVSYGLRS